MDLGRVGSAGGSGAGDAEEFVKVVVAGCVWGGVGEVEGWGG